ncbi:MAG: 16S rRNA (guanine(966)-N(2))-methyltransferase RsmD [Microbacteriaceae bacterium]|jgi:16S rRNA (guanine966-N2)-methyltransferase|nr:16S rRNA (guanine(966)-N(2))-methyltransferase RsmD [Microbacteriaceae bacterium]
MTRIIGGIAGSRKLASPAKATRPTSDRIRESIFSRLDSRDALDGARVLDLYAGTGALALEAISRGAVLAHMVERDGKAAAVCVANAKSVQKAITEEDFEAETKVINKSVQSFLAAPTESNFTIVFIDPPYEIDNDEVVSNLDALLPILNPEALVAVERSSRSEKPEFPLKYELVDEKNYGDTIVYWLELGSS